MDSGDIYILKSEIENIGFSVYVDWIEDRSLNRSQVAEETAERLRNRISNCKSLFFATSENSSTSIWMPWELGYFDGFKGKIAILPILNVEPQTEIYIGQEYLGLYPYVTKCPYENLPKETLWINENPQIYVSIHEWLLGKKPYKR